MKKKALLALILSMLSLNSFAESGLTKYAYQTISDFLQNPKTFFMDIQYDIEDTTPVWNKNTNIQTNLFMQGIGIANFNFKTEVISEKQGVPQITAGLGGWYFWGAKLLTEIPDLEKAKNINIYGFVPFVTVSYGVTHDVDFFAGSKLSIGHVEMDFRDVVAEEISNKSFQDLVKNVSYMNETYIDPAVYVGMGLKTSETSKIFAQVGYQLIEQRIYAKLNFAGEVWEWGIGFYPDSVIIIHPIINISLKFDI